MGLLDDIIEKAKKDLKRAKQNSLEGKTLKEGRTWQQIASEFVIEAKKMLKKHPAGYSISGTDMRTIVGDPRNRSFKKWCREYGVSVIKVRHVDIYNIKEFDILAKKLKEKNENTRLF